MMNRIEKILSLCDRLSWLSPYAAALAIALMLMAGMYATARQGAPVERTSVIYIARAKDART